MSDGIYWREPTDPDPDPGSGIHGRSNWPTMTPASVNDKSDVIPRDKPGDKPPDSRQGNTAAGMRPGQTITR